MEHHGLLNFCDRHHAKLISISTPVLHSIIYNATASSNEISNPVQNIISAHFEFHFDHVSVILPPRLITAIWREQNSVKIRERRSYNNRF